MYSVELGFNSKSSSSKIKKAIKIANEIGFKIDEDDKNIIIITSNELNKKIIELLTLIRYLSKTYLKINGEDIEGISELIEIIDCKRRNSCKGKCAIQEDVWNVVFALIGFIKNDYCFIDDDPFDFINDSNLIIEESDEEIIIDKIVLFNRYNDSRKLLCKYCPKFNDEEIIIKFNSLPDKILIKKSDFNKDEYGDNDLSGNEEEGTSYMDILIKKFSDEVEERLKKVLKEFKDK